MSHKGRILVLESNAVLLEICAAGLKAAGYVVEPMIDDRHFDALLAQTDVVAVICEEVLHLSPRQGHNLWEQYRAHLAERRIVFILTSDSPSRKFVVPEDMSNPGFAFLQQPYGQHVLHDTLAACLDCFRGPG